MNMIGFAVVVALLVLAYVVTWALLRRKNRTQAETKEDILKQVYHLREKKRDVTLESISGALHVPQNSVAPVIAELNAEGLLETRGEHFRLTEDGTTVALKLVRSHRLWERYLADETGVRENRWHSEAEKQEHRLTAEETDALSRRLGHPMYDPHGDPIPQEDLDLPGPKGTSLALASLGDEYIVIHLEDEPSAVYDELVANEVFRGSRIRLLVKDQSHAELECDGRPIRLPLLSVSNISVVPSKGKRTVVQTGSTLSDLHLGEEGRVISLSPACRGMQRRRLLDLGILPGTTVRAELVSPLGDPVGYRVRGSLVALRKAEASYVNVEKSA